jgi:hypothetical protein
VIVTCERQLRADDGLDAHLLAGAGEANRAVEAIVVGERQRRHAESGRALRQLLGQRRAVEQRERRMAVKLHVALHGAPSSTFVRM